MSKANILLVGSYNRTDYLEQFKVSLSSFNFFFLEYISPLEEENKDYTTYGNAIYWSNYKNAFELLDNIKPVKVLFIYIEAYNHVALNLSCQERNIPTYVIDHGILDININVRFADQLLKQYYTRSLKSKFIFSLLIFQRFKTRLFLNNTIKLLSPVNQCDIKEFINLRSRYRFEATIKNKHFFSRLPNYYITFSKKNFEFYEIQDYHTSKNRFFTIGLPQFDNLANLKQSMFQENQIIFIDQPLATKKLFGWTSEFHAQFTTRFTKICKDYSYKLYVKVHPLQSVEERNHWLQESEVSVIEGTDLKNIISGSQVVMGFFSTLLLPLCVMPHTILITLENHPAGRLNVSKSFIDAGVAHPIYKLEELPSALENREQLHQQQQPHKKQFENDWLYKFDGKSGERLRDILLQNVL